MQTKQLPSESDLAGQIREAINSRVKLVPIEQTKEMHCDGPEEVLRIFTEAISKYPPSILRLPLSTILVEVSDDNAEHLGKRKLKKAISQLTKVIQSTLDIGDLMVRYDKRKFALLLIDVDELAAGKICQRIKEAIHHHWYCTMKLKNHLCIEFAVAQHDIFSGNDFAELIFGNERNIHLARALGDGAVITRTDAKDRFREHRGLHFRLGERFRQDVYEAGDQD